MKIKEYLLQNYSIAELNGCAEHGCSEGFGTFVYYKDTVAFHDEHEEEIWDLLHGEAEGCGFKSVLEMLASFNGAKDVGDLDELKNLLCWYAVEHFARKIVEEKEGKNE